MTNQSVGIILSILVLTPSVTAQQSIDKLAASRDGLVAISYHQHMKNASHLKIVRVVDTSTNRTVHTFVNGSHGQFLAEGRIFAALREPNRLVKWDTKTWDELPGTVLPELRIAGAKSTYRHHLTPVDRVEHVVMLGEDRFVYWYFDRRLSLWDNQKSELFYNHKQIGDPRYASSSSKEPTVIVSRVWEDDDPSGESPQHHVSIRSGDDLREIDGFYSERPGELINDVAITPDGSHAAIFEFHIPEEGELTSACRLWSIERGDDSLITVWSTAAKGISSISSHLCFSDDSKYLAIIDDFGKVHIVDVRARDTLKVADHKQENDGWRAAVFIPGTTMLATVDRKLQIHVWDPISEASEEKHNE